MFVGPYEHHSNEVTWRQGLATVVEVNLAPDGGMDLAHLEALLKDPQYQGRLRIGSFSAASNVTGMRSPVREIARLLHEHGAYACFDYAASGPYVEIDMNPPRAADGGDASIDAVFLSPHKFLGGPGSSGVLVFQHYASNGRIQVTEFIASHCDSPDFFRGNAKKYLARYGHKEGYNRKDLMKALHYLIMLVDWHDKNAKELPSYITYSSCDADLEPLEQKPIMDLNWKFNKFYGDKK